MGDIIQAKCECGFKSREIYAVGLLKANTTKKLMN